jgi:alkylresorcinol/alkylpyrone synthase
MPFTELGCAAGAMALSRSADYLRANPGGNVLIIAVELPSLTFQRKDISQANLISSILFGDGAAAVVVTGKEKPGPRILATETYTFPDSLGAMGFDLRDSGFHILLAKDVPEMIGAKIQGLVHDFLARCGKVQSDIKGWILHPGGARLLGNIEKELGLCKCDTQTSWDILRNVGNLSSATILFILQEWLEKRPLKTGEYALAGAFGPGFSAEFLLLQWN